jgi:hypothetical protein
MMTPPKRQEFSKFDIGDRVRWYGQLGTIVAFEDGRPVVLMDAHEVRVMNVNHLQKVRETPQPSR